MLVHISVHQRKDFKDFSGRNTEPFTRCWTIKYRNLNTYSRYTHTQGALMVFWNTVRSKHKKSIHAVQSEAKE
jgi:hypothetical protein